MEYKTILKIDNDIPHKYKYYKFLRIRLKFLFDINLLKKEDIILIEYLFKSNFSTRIYLNKKFSPKEIIIFQSILGDDFKRIGINLRDYTLGISDWNRLFTTKRYVSGEYKTARIKDITKIILDKINTSN